jgi:carboxyl-terminal processing protease
MKNFYKVKHRFAVFAIAGIVFITSCKKNDVQNLTPQPPQTSLNDKLKDTVVLYARDIYLWYSQIPSSFNGRNYSDPDKIMNAIRNYSIDPGFSQPVDKWSFAVKKAEWDNVSSGISQDFGLNVFFNAEGDLRVKYVEKESPAGRAGIHRGWRITRINGNSNMTTSNADLIVQGVYNSTSSSFTFQKPDGTTSDITLNAAAYQEHSVLLDTIYTSNAKKTGYLVFNSFLGDTTEIYNQFQRIFNNFGSQQINELVVDLRYNGGGYVSVQEKLANYIVNNTAAGQMMMKQQFNDKYTQFNETTNFSKQGPLNLDRVFFIVSKSTASASELLINNLKPYMDVKLVGPSNTYGKPVGFFPIPVNDWYIFPVSFRTVNKNGEGNYFNGITINNQVADGLDKDWGDLTENSLASVFKYINTGGFRARMDETTTPYVPNPRVVDGNKILDEPSFKGIIDTQRKFH